MPLSPSLPAKRPHASYRRDLTIGLVVRVAIDPAQRTVDRYLEGTAAFVLPSLKPNSC